MVHKVVHKQKILHAHQWYGNTEEVKRLIDLYDYRDIELLYNLREGWRLIHKASNGHSLDSLLKEGDYILFGYSVIMVKDKTLFENEYTVIEHNVR